MTNRQIDEYFANKSGYIGCMSKDEFTTIKNELNYLVINLEDSDAGNGTHWVCLLNSNTYCYYFDSFGFPPPENVRQIIKRDLNKRIVYNTSQIQNEKSSLCGYYCLYFIDWMLKKPDDYLSFIMQFDKRDGDKDWKNEQIIGNYFSL